MQDREKIIIKSNTLPGVDMSVHDHSYFFSTPVAWTKVVTPLFKKRGIWLLGLEANLNVRDVVQVVGSPVAYRIIKFVKMEDNQRVYRVKRVDNYSITATDVVNMSAGQKVRIKNRSGIKHGLFSTKE